MIRKPPQYDNGTPQYRATLKAEALRLAALGIPTFPANVTASVNPRTGEATRNVYPCANWDEAATTDPARIARVWDNGTWNALCMPTGVPTPFGRIFVVDGDRHGAADGVTEVERLGITSPVTASTPSGGRHVFTLADPDRPCPRNSASTIAEAVDGRGEGGFVIIAPTVDFRGAYSYDGARLDETILPSLPPAPEVAYAAKRAPKRGTVARATSGRLVVAGDFEVVDPETGEIFEFSTPGRLFTMERAVQFCAPALDRLRNTPYRQGINHALNSAALQMSHFIGDFWDEAYVTATCMEAQLRPGWERSGAEWEKGLRTVGSALTSPARFEWTAELIRDDETEADEASPFDEDEPERPEPGAWRRGTNRPVPTWHAFSADPPLFEVDAAGVADLPVHERDKALDAAFQPGTPGCLPAAFFDARPAHAHVRDVAYARGVSATSTFMCTLATIAAVTSPKIKVDTGIMDVTGLQTFVAMVAPSGVGKSASKAVSAMIAPLPNDGRVADLNGTSVSTGQGMLEHFIGKVVPPKLPPKQDGGGDDADDIDLDGPEPEDRKPKRGQVKWHGLFYVDEGGLIFEHNAKRDSILGSIVKQLWHGRSETPNATAELRRKVDDVSIGLMAGFQIGDNPTVGPLLADDSGLVQRFLLCSATDPNRPRRRLPMPPQGARLTNAVFALDPRGEWDGTMHLPPEATEELEERLAWQHMPEAQRPEGVFEDGRDSHWPLHLARLAGLLAILDYRHKITLDDWRLAKVVYDTSSSYRRHLMAGLRSAEDARREAQREDAKQTALVIDSALAEQIETRELTKAERDAARVGKTVAKWVNHPDTPVRSRKAMRAKLTGSDKAKVDDAIGYAVGKGWITQDGSNLGPRVVSATTHGDAADDVEA